MSDDDMNDDTLKSLRRLEAPAPSDAARKRALAAAMTAFEAAKTTIPEKSATATQGTGWSGRLKSIFSTKRTWNIMDIRLPLGTAAVALLLLPLGYQLYATTSMTPLQGTDIVIDRPRDVVATPDAVTVDDGTANTVAADPSADATEETDVAVGDERLQTREEEPVTQATTVADVPAGEAAKEEPNQPTTETPPVELAQTDTTVQPLGGVVETEVAPKMDAEVPADGDALGRTMMAPEAAAGTVAPTPMMTAESGAVAESFADMAVAEPMPMSPTIGPMESGDEFTSFEESPLKVVADEPVSTFSIDVDTASYSYVRRMLTDGYVPEPDSVRIEELINYFPYDYPATDTTETPFKPTMAIYPTPWNPETQLLHIGIKGYEPPVTEHLPTNLTFLIDTSGSMDEPDKLPLLKRAFSLLVDNLDPTDTVSIVVYAGSAGVVLEPTKASDKAKILAALENLYAGGSTAGAEGIELAYRLAEQNKIPDGNNRVILATDGDFNVGIADPDALIDFIKEKRDSGVFLSVLGFGQGNLDDATMQALAQNGNGNASYIDSFREAQKVLVEEGGSNLVTIAKDVKIQIEFNPAFVSEYRLIGYETRALNREDFNNDKVDAGDIGAGHTVTAIYEITPAGSGAELVDPLRFGGETATPEVTLPASNEIAFLKMRYKAPDSDVSQLIEVPVTRDLVLDSLSEASNDIRFAAAVAAFGQKLKDSNYGDMSWDAILDLAQGGRGEDESGYRAEFVQLVRLAANLQ